MLLHGTLFSLLHRPVYRLNGNGAMKRDLNIAYSRKGLQRRHPQRLELSYLLRLDEALANLL